MLKIPVTQTVKPALMAGVLGFLAACGQSPTANVPQGTSTTQAGSAQVEPTPSAIPSTPIRAQGLVDPFSPAGDPDSVNFTLEGCRNDGTPPITLPNSSGQFICPDAAYTTGNLGKGWNELDLVPYRVTVDAGNAAPATQKYSLAFVVDNMDGGKPGYDYLSAPVLNTALSSASCTQADYSVENLLTPGLGGTESSRYRLVNITQPKNSTCVYDYFARLAIGSHLFPGSSLHANLANKVLTTAGIGSKDVSIPVKEIKPQEITKDMQASQGADKVWNITKKPTPATVNFGDVCAAGAPTDQGVKISIDWKVIQVVPGNVTLVSNIYATNPAARTITVNVTDRMYQGTDQSNLISTSDTLTKDILANSKNVLVMTHSYSLNTAESMLGQNFNDVATATYTDKATAIPVPGQTTAAASATVSAGTITNALASISDSEKITGQNLTFAVATPTLGAFTNGYVAGTFVTGPVDWGVNSQVTDGGVVFDKTIRLDSRNAVSGSLSDTATLNGSDGSTFSASAAVDISSTANVVLSIRKTIPDVLQGDETQTFTFNVKNSAGQVVASPSIKFSAGETSKTIEVSVSQTATDDGMYTVEESAANGWASQASQTSTIKLPNCAGSVEFNNAIVPARAAAVKSTVPAGAQEGWSFTLKRDGDAAGTTATTDGNGNISFNANLGEGHYTITETPRDGWDLTSQKGCDFTVNYPADAGKTFTCEAQNTQRGKIIVKKVTLPAGDAQEFTFTPVGFGSAFTLKDGGNLTSDWLKPGSYSVTEALPAGWQQQSATCDNGSPVTAIKVDAGKTTTCTFTNLKLPKLTVIKVVNNEFGGTKVVSDFPLRVNGTVVSSGAPGTYPVGSYTVSEQTPLPYGYTQDSITGDCDTSGLVTLNPGDNKTCTITNSDSPGTITVIKNAKPANGTFAFQTTGTGYGSFTLQGAAGSNVNTQSNLSAGTYTVTESTQLGWILTGIGGSSDPNTPFNCVVVGQGGSSGLGDLNTQTASITLKMGDTVTCTFENTGQGVTRTQGFWATHPNLALVAWTGGNVFNHSFPGVSATPGIGDMLLCNRTINAGDLLIASSSDLMGGFWSDISRSTLQKRSALDQARMQLLQQMLAAELNASAFGSLPSGGVGMFAAWESAYCGQNTTAIKNAQQQAASFNTAGDSGTFTPGTSANSKLARIIANDLRWDLLP